MFGLARKVILVVAGAYAANAATAGPGDPQVLKVQGNVFLIAGSGGNIAVQVGKQGVLLVDSGSAADADRVLQEVRKLSGEPIRWIIDTSADADHVGGNEKIAASGKSIVGGNESGQLSSTASESAGIVAHEKVMNRMSAPTGQESPTPPAAWPTDTFFVNAKNMFFNGEALQLIHQPDAHTDGDVMVFFRRSDVIATGEIFRPDRYPTIDIARGGGIQGVVAGLNEIMRVTIPAEKQEAGTYVIPGHGRICDQADIVEYRDMLTIIRDRLQDMIKKGMTLEQAKAARPTRDYDPLYGSTSGEWTTDMFVEAAYKSLSQPKKK
jgi:glyoxylase-like metal-dependent hydrolase (beta-lactamase superfamily II)